MKHTDDTGYKEKMKRVWNALPKCNGTNRHGNPCSAPAVKGRRFCKAHGGNNKSGYLAGQAKHLKYSLALPKDIASNYETAMSDPMLVQLRKDIALWDARVMQLSERLKSSETPYFIRGLKSSLSQMYDKVQKGELTVEDMVSKMNRIIDRRGKQDDAWNEVMKASEMKRKLISAEAKRLKDMDAVLTMEQAMALLGMVASEVRKYLSAVDLAKFQAEMAQHLNLSNRHFQHVTAKQLGEELFQESVDEEGDAYYNHVTGEVLDAEEVEMTEEEIREYEVKLRKAVEGDEGLD